MASRKYVKGNNKLSSIRKALGKEYENLNEVLAPYIEELVDKDIHLKIEGKLLEHANREQPSWISFFDERRIELSTYVKFFEMEVGRVRARILKNMEKYPRELSDRAKDKYIDGHEDYLEVYEKYLSVKELHGLYESVVESFKQRGFALRNITNIRVAALEDVVI